jgi:hypothetical protein
MYVCGAEHNIHANGLECEKIHMHFCTCTYTKTCTHTHACMHTGISTYIRKCTRCYIHACMPKNSLRQGPRTGWYLTYTHTCVHAWKNTVLGPHITAMHRLVSNMHVYIHACIHAYMHTRIHAYIHEKNRILRPQTMTVSLLLNCSRMQTLLPE